MNKAKEIMEQSNGRVFTVEFVKKNGELRRLNCRLNVKKYLAGGQLRYDNEALGLMPVFDMRDKSYKMVNLATVKSITLDGKEYIFV